LIEIPAKPIAAKGNETNISIQMIQVANQITKTTSVTEILNSPEFISLPSAQKEEMKEQIEALDTELAKDNPKWDAIKRILVWALNFGKDVFFQLLPYIYAKSQHIS
jgi:hypothetical protein